MESYKKAHTKTINLKYYPWREIKIAWPKFPDGSYSVSDIQDYFHYIIIKHETVTDNLPLGMYLTKLENRIYIWK